MSKRLDTLLDDLGATSEEARPGKVASPEGTTRPENPTINPHGGEPMPPDIDSLFGNRQAYFKIRREKTQHRLLLWYKLQAFNNKECAQILGYSEAWVSQISNQPWFQEAFCALAKEMGKDAIQTYLEGEVMPALERTAAIARNSESDQVRLAANRELLDRFLGKATVKVESKSVVDVNHTVLDANRLLEEQRRLDEQIKANGLAQHGNS